MNKFIALRPKAYSHITDDGNEDKKSKGTKKCVTKRELKLKDFKKCLETSCIEDEINYLKYNKIVWDSLKEN